MDSIERRLDALENTLGLKGCEIKWSKERNLRLQSMLRRLAEADGIKFNTEEEFIEWMPKKAKELRERARAKAIGK